MPDVVNFVRIQQTNDTLTALQQNITEWLTRQERRDVKKQYGTHLRALRTQLSALLSEVRTAQKDIHEDGSRGDVYSRCRLQDRRMLWIERLWYYFRDKFDQREDPRYGDVLRAADEIVWSCYAQPFRALKTDLGAAPLPWLTPEYSPKAIPRSEIPQALRSDVDSEFLRRMLQELPIPLVGLPPQCVYEPWWLIYLAHEVGHHVEFDLESNSALIDKFRDFVAGLVPADSEPDRWRYRAEEIFADACSIYFTGPWALWALTELVWSTDEAMKDESNVRYPAAVARLQLMNELVARLKIDKVDALRGYPEPMPGDRALMALADGIDSQPVVGRKTIAQLCQWQAADHLGKKSAVALWKQAFVKQEPRNPEETLRSARTVLAGGIAAWSQFSLEPNGEKRGKAKNELAKRLLEALQASHEPVERAAEKEPAFTTDVSKKLVSLLFEANPDKLGAW